LEGAAHRLPPILITLDPCQHRYRILDGMHRPRRHDGADHIERSELTF
jgi:hypothetical protein